MIVWFYLWPYMQDEALSEAEIMEVFLTEKKILAKEFAKQSL